MEEENRETERLTKAADEPKPDNIIRIAVLGQDLVGKTALIYRFIRDKFPSTRETTVEDQYKKIVNINDVECQLEILDTAGQDIYQTMLESWIEFASCFLLVYSIDNEDSFTQVKQKYEKIVEKKGKQFFGVVIIGNKSDLDDNERKVKKEEAEMYASNIGVDVIETSALNNINVTEGFLKVSEIYLNNKINKNEKKKLGCPCF